MPTALFIYSDPNKQKIQILKK